MKIEKYKFGKFHNEEEVYLYNIKNEDIDIEIISYGGIIKSLKTKNKENKFENIVLGYETLEEYLKDSYYFGCIVGRNAGRIKNSILNIESEKYTLEKNNGENNLHGGINSLNTKNWSSETKIEDEKGILTLSYKSPHLENGFPGEIDFKVVYTVYKNELKIEYFGKSDRDTYINLTNHSYFNLSGNAKNDIKGSEIKINATGYGWLNKECLPEKLEKNNSFLTFNTFNKIKEVLENKHEQIKIVGGGIDHPFELEKNQEYNVEFRDEVSGRNLKIKSTEPVAVIYSGNFLEKKYNGICFEMQDYPDIYNFMPSKMKIYNRNNLYKAATVFKFND